MTTSVAAPKISEPHSTTLPTAFFEIWFAEEVSMTSTRFSGGDWRWKFRSNAGVAIAAGDGYRSKAACEEAVAALRAGAGTAPVRHLA